MAKDVKRLKWIISWLGFDPSNGKWHITVYTYAIVICFLIINATTFVVDKWEDVGKRLDGVKGLVMYLLCLSYFISLTCNWEDSMLVIKIIEDGLYKGTFRPSTKESVLRKRIGLRLSQLTTNWFYALVGYATMVIVTPISVFVFRLLQYGINDLAIDLLYTSIPFYYPKSYETITVYFLAYTMQSFFLLYGTFSSCVTLVMAFNSMQLIEGELKMLTLSLHEFDAMNNIRITIDGSHVYDNKDKDGTKCILPSDESSMCFLRYFVKHHNTIYRKVKDVTKGIKLVAFTINSGLSILLCTSIYSLARRNELLIVTQEAIFGSFISVCLYCYNLMGEKISTQDEHLRRAMYEIKWMDQPQMFKKVFQIIMTRANRPVEINLFGLFVLNLRNFILTVRAAYSYYNILSNS